MEIIDYHKFVKYGDYGPAIVFLLGANSEPYFYKLFLEKLSEIGFQIYAIKHPGIANEHTLETYNLQSCLDYVDWVIESIHLADKYYLMGFSAGGYFTLKYAERSENLLGMILLSPYTKLHSRGYFMLAIREILNEFQNLFSKNEYKPMSLFSFANLKYLKAKQKLSELIMNLKPINIEESLPNIKSLVILGSKDLIVDSEFSIKVFSNNTYYKMYVIEKGHDAYYLNMSESIHFIKTFTEYTR